MFVEDKDASGKSKSTSKKTVKSAAPQKDETVPSVSPQPTGSRSTTGQANDKFMAILFGAMDKANLPGFDYLEYKQSLRNFG